jgi:hypothetical protein
MLLLSHDINFENAFNIYPVTYLLCISALLLCVVPLLNSRSSWLGLGSVDLTSIGNIVEDAQRFSCHLIWLHRTPPVILPR